MVEHEREGQMASQSNESCDDKHAMHMLGPLEGLRRLWFGDEADAEHSSDENLTGIDALNHRLFHLSSQEEDTDAKVGHHSTHLDELAAVRGRLWDTTPVEKEIYKNHTKCFGLFFSTLEMERTFLDSHARLKKNIVYWGYAILVLVTLYRCLVDIFRYDVERVSCSEGIPECTYYASDDWSSQDKWKEQLATEAKYFFSITFTLAFVGSCLHWFIHRSPKVKEKSWTFLIVFMVECLVLIGLYAAIMLLFGGNGEYNNESWWPLNIYPVTIEILTILFFFSGIVSFVLVLLLCVLAFVMILAAYFGWTQPNAREKYGTFSQEVAELVFYITQNSLILLLLALIYLAGAYLMEIAYRKEFLSRMLMHNQQKQIIAEKSKNENLQRQLLENMLPTSIVDQLQKQNFTISSWEQLRALSHRHFGVSIMFADLENFTAFSSEVSPAGVMEYLNDLFLVFDNLCEQHAVYKVETVGDQYVAAVGVVTGEILTENILSMRGIQPMLSSSSFDEIHKSRGEYSSNFDEASIEDAACSNTAHMIAYAKAIIEGSKHVVVPPGVESCPVLRVGIHTGPCISGIVGTKNFRFCLFGDTMNTAARMEQTSVAECIHVTEDVVALAPDHSWEKLEKLHVKGKGSMQTYLLRVSFDGLGFETAGAASENAHGSPQAMEDMKDMHHNEDLLSSVHFVRSMSGVGADVSPVKEDVFRHHTKWFGLFFKKLDVEHLFYDTHARLYKNDVYLGYFFFAVAFLFNLLIAYILFWFMNLSCIDPGLKDFCITSFGEGAYIFAQSYDMGDRISYEQLVNTGYWRMTPVTTVLVSILFAYGILSHWGIHRAERFKRKSWALLNVWIVYLLILILMDVTIIFFRLSSSTTVQWPFGLYVIFLVQSTLLVLCAGVPFILNLLWWFIASGLYYGFAIPVILQDKEAVDTGSNYTPSLAIQLFYDFSTFLFEYSVILLIGSYLNDVNNRKRFLQRILLLDQQDQIIRVKAKNEKTQRTFLENILPPSLVGELQMQQNDLGESGYRRLKSLSESHVGVSMLYADLVGFTAFSSQVDPFKVMSFLNDLFHVFDGLCDQYNVYKVETIGDCYVATVGLVTGNMLSKKLYASDLTLQDFMRDNKEAVANCKDLVGFAKAMLIESRQVMKPVVNTPAIMRIGIHTGSCISGIIGTKMLKFSLIGDLVVTAAEMEKSGTPDCIHASQDLVDLVPDEPWKKKLQQQKKKRNTMKTDKDSLEQQQQTYLLLV